jgi:toxin YoeB
MIVCFHDNAWQDYCYWQNIDKKIVKRINDLIKDIACNPFEGIGKPEPLRFEWQGYWSRRINDEHRLIYCIKGDSIIITQCSYHY